MSARVVASIRPLLESETEKDVIVEAAKALGKHGDSKTIVKIPNAKNESRRILVARIRPLLKNEVEKDIIVEAAKAPREHGDGKTMVKIPNAKTDAEFYSFKCNSVYDQHATQQDIFEDEGKSTRVEKRSLARHANTQLDSSYTLSRALAITILLSPFTRPKATVVCGYPPLLSRHFCSDPTVTPSLGQDVLCEARLVATPA
ncbi:hypothetical protein AC578_5848 [Pseudocercospora eumusae]|uniref:Kinesin motor domain-containing protein n=1 Tax=Pseudocercospora eumusae TaxID=321146 RepID=A0A139GXV9_9PEZI|nr:hypothetical protein AC578_5848 [Pseudocercospora eumusae]